MLSAAWKGFNWTDCSATASCGDEFCGFTCVLASNIVEPWTKKQEFLISRMGMMKYHPIQISLLSLVLVVALPVDKGKMDFLSNILACVHMFLCVFKH